LKAQNLSSKLAKIASFR